MILVSFKQFHPAFKNNQDSIESNFQTFNKTFQIYSSNDNESCQNVPEAVAQILGCVNTSLNKHLCFIDRRQDGFFIVVVIAPKCETFEYFMLHKHFILQIKSVTKVDLTLFFHSLGIPSYY